MRDTYQKNNAETTIDLISTATKQRLASPYLEVSPYEADGGEKVGSNPTSISKRELQALGHPESPIKAIRAKCLDCCGGQVAEARKCTATGCPLWPFRMGKNPFHARAKTGGAS